MRMKKFFLTVSVVFTFLAYSYVLRHQHYQPVIAPASLSKNSSNENTANNGTNNSSSSSNSSSNTSTPNSSPSSNNGAASAQYKDGSYTGSVENAYYGNIQVSATIQNGKLTSVNVLQSPNDNPNSVNINSQALPYLKQEAVQAQSSNIDSISGATFTSQAFTQSLSTALQQAKQG
jgi:uncharacterized protein with FMN-binding domain